MGKCKVESGKWKVSSFLLGYGGCRAATGGVVIPLFNILFSLPSLVLKTKIEQTDLAKNPAQGLRKQYIEQTQTLLPQVGEGLDVETARRETIQPFKTIPLQMVGVGVVRTSTMNEPLQEYVVHCVRTSSIFPIRGRKFPSSSLGWGACRAATGEVLDRKSVV